MEDLEVFAQDNFSRCSRHVVSVVALLGLSIVFSVVMIPAPTSTPDDCLSSTSMRTDVLSIRGSSTCEVSLDICVCTDAAFNDDLMDDRCFYSFLPSCFPRVLYCGRSSWCSPIPCVVMDRRCGVSLPGSVLRDGYTHVMGLDVAASHWPAVEAATTKFPLDVAASLVPAVAAAAIMSFLDVAASLESAVEAAAILSSLLAHSFYNLLSHDCDMRSVVFRQARQSPPFLEYTRFLRFLHAVTAR